MTIVATALVILLGFALAAKVTKSQVSSIILPAPYDCQVLSPMSREREFDAPFGEFARATLPTQKCVD